MSLERTFSDLNILLGSQGETFPVIQRVEQHRHYWRPSKTRLVLLAESHVRTNELEYARCIRRLDWMPKDLPLGFVRLVYCLGYGENELMDEPVTPNGGTPHFWKIFYSCINDVSSNGDFAPILKGTTHNSERGCTKLGVLNTLKDRGVWLIDASIVALYPKPNVDLQKVLQISWKSYVRSEIHEANPDGILCIGVGVARSLKSYLDELGIPWGVVPQPNARLSQNEHLSIFDTYRRVSNEPGRSRELSERWFRGSFK